MATLPVPVDEIIAKWGPHKHYMTKESAKARASQTPGELVKTHCCFCGLQCGVRLKMKNKKAVGFGPWREFPFNERRLCPKGVQRYIQDNHPDRLLQPIKRVGGVDFVLIEWEGAYSTVVSEIKRIQEQYDRNAFAMPSGTSPSTEKSCLVGRFARVALKTANLNYNGRLCMVSAGAGNKKAFGMDGSSNSWADLAHAEMIIITGADTSECFPVLTYRTWGAYDNGAKIIVIGPRVILLVRTADVHLPLCSGADTVLMSTMLKVFIDNDWLDHDFIDNYTSGWERTAKTVEHRTPEWGEKTTGVPEELIYKAAEMWGKTKTSFLVHARGIEQHRKGVLNMLSCINLVLITGRIGKPYRGYGTITGQGNGQGGREHGHKCDQLPGSRDIENPEYCQIVTDSRGVPESELPRKGLSAYEIIDVINKGEIKGLLSICFNPIISLPNNKYIKSALEKPEFYTGADSFLSEILRHANVVLVGFLQEEEEGTTTIFEGRVVRISGVVTPPGKAKRDIEILRGLAKRLGQEDKLNFPTSEDMFSEIRHISKGSHADYYGITYEKVEKNMSAFWSCPSLDHPGTPRLWEDHKFKTNDGKAHFNPAPCQPPVEEPDADYPVVFTTGRVVSQYLSGTQTRRIGRLVDIYPEPLMEIHPKLVTKYDIEEGDLVHITTRRNSTVFPANVVVTIREDSIFVPYHWGGVNSVNQPTVGLEGLDPISKMSEFKVCTCKIEKTGEKKAKDSAEYAYRSRDVLFAEGDTPIPNQVKKSIQKE